MPPVNYFISKQDPLGQLWWWLEGASQEKGTEDGAAAAERSTR